MNRRTIAVSTGHARPASGNLDAQVVALLPDPGAESVLLDRRRPCLGGRRRWPPPTAGRRVMRRRAVVDQIFDTLPRLGTTGTIKVFGPTAALVDTINLADASSLRRSGGRRRFRYRTAPHCGGIFRDHQRQYRLDLPAQINSPTEPLIT